MAAHQAILSLGFSRQGYWSGLPFPSPKDACVLSRFSRVWLCTTLWTATHQAPLSTGFSRQEYWSGLPLPSPEISVKALINQMHLQSKKKKNPIMSIPMYIVWNQKENTLKGEGEYPHCGPLFFIALVPTSYQAPWTTERFWLVQVTYSSIMHLISTGPDNAH